MKTIEERAKEFAQNFEFVEKDMDCGNCNTCRKCKDYRRYVDIVTEQREIDIEKACEWLKARNVLTEASLEIFRKVMEE